MVQYKIAVRAMQLEIVVVSEVFAGAIGAVFKKVGFG
jgi:hypothetical protein